MMRTLVFIALLAIPCFGQTAPNATGSATTTGSCSPAVSGNNNKFTITCQNVPEKIRLQFVDLLNRLAKNETDAEAMLSKLDGCLAGVKEVREEQQPWRLSDDQKTQLQRILTRAGVGDAKVVIHVLPSDRNAALMGVDLLKVLEQAGWTKEGITTDYFVPPELVGIELLVKDPSLPQANVLGTALKGIGLMIGGEIDKTGHYATGPSDVAIVIGAKPTPKD